MQATETPLAERFAALPIISDLPEEERAWLVEHGELDRFSPGEVISSKGKRIEKLYIVLSERITIWIEGRASQGLLMEIRAGEATGRLPFSRMGESAGDNIIEVGGDVLTVHESHFPEMISKCPHFVEHSVHNMLDRARTFKSSQLQDEKMVSLGRLAAGLAHELNNPSSAISRSSRILVESLTEIQEASMAIGAAGISAGSWARLMQFRTTCLAKRPDGVLSALERADREDEIHDWLDKNDLDTEHAPMLADACVSVDTLQNLANDLEGEDMDLILKWIDASCSTFSLATEIEAASSNIFDLVSAVKTFTFMDQETGTELVHLESGIRDTVRVLASKAKSKNVAVKLNFEPHLRPVKAKGAELNQVWMNLVDNALDAISDAGTIEINARSDGGSVVVCVIDDGPGIPADIVGKVFDAFFTTKPPGEGTGLGLEMARQIVRRYRGDIDVKSRPGCTEFSVRLPVASTPEGQ